MHPIFSSSRSFAALALIWLSIALLAAILVAVNSHSLSLDKNLYLQTLTWISPWYFVYLFFCLSNYYLCQRWPISSTSLAQLIGLQLFAGLVSTALWMALGFGWAHTLKQLGLSDVISLYEHTFIANSLLAAILYSAWILVHYLYLMATDNEERINESLQQQLLISEIELQTVKASTHPHFMYNSLNMLANLSLVAPEKIHDICVQMSEFLRYSVNYAKNPHVSIDDEVTHIQNYLNIERERFGNHLELHFDIDDKLRKEPCMPLLLFPLIENCIKHGIDSSLDQGSITLSIEEKNTTVLVHVENSYDAAGQRRDGTHLGLSSLKKRLYSYYGREASLEVNRTEHFFSVDILLPSQPVNTTSQQAQIP